MEKESPFDWNSPLLFNTRTSVQLWRLKYILSIAFSLPPRSYQANNLALALSPSKAAKMTTSNDDYDGATSAEAEAADADLKVTASLLFSVREPVAKTGGRIHFYSGPAELENSLWIVIYICT